MIISSDLRLLLKRVYRVCPIPTSTAVKGQFLLPGSGIMLWQMPSNFVLKMELLLVIA